MSKNKKYIVVTGKARTGKTSLINRLFPSQIVEFSTDLKKEDFKKNNKIVIECQDIRYLDSYIRENLLFQIHCEIKKGLGFSFRTVQFYRFDKDNNKIKCTLTASNFMRFYNKVL